MDKLKRFISSKYFKLLIVGIGILLIVIFFISTMVNGKRTRTCNSLREDIIASLDDYVTKNNLLPKLNGTSVTVDITNADKEFTMKDNKITGTVTYTNYNGEFIKTVKIENADYCTTKKFNKETDKYDEKKNNEVAVYYNYNNVETFNSKWSEYIPSNEISTEDTNGVYLPSDTKKLPAIPSNAVIAEYVTENKTYYSYRDKQYRYYKNNIKYSSYSSVKPSGYTNKDNSTEKETEPTEWSLDYPEEYSYRAIKTKTGYQWYYTENKQRVYWENGKYSIESPGEKYKNDPDTAAKMYSYTDKMWRWYNGDTKRGYSGYLSEMPKNYSYRDDSTLNYTKWSTFKDKSYVTNENKSYREEKTDIRTRYLIKYEIHYEELLDEPVSLEELENILGKSYEEILKDETLNVNVIFKFKQEAK